MLFITAKKQGKNKCPSTGKWINKIRVHIYAMGYYSTIKRNEMLTDATTWMNLKNIMLRSQTQKAKYCPIPFIRNVQNKQIY